jgi:hypothetical protein
MCRQIINALSLLLLTVGVSWPIWAQDCPASALARPKGNTFFLVFATSDDASYPEHGADCGAGTSTSPLADFDVADLDSTIGTTEQLRQRIFELMTDDYCEFNVEVRRVASVPTPTDPRWQVVGIGSDSDPNCFGLAQDVDTGDGDAQDFARVWAATFGDAFGGAGGALAGTNSTLERWATAIAGTASHEAGHNYGASHGNASALAGEDVTTNHIMATNSLGLTGEIRAGVNRHFSDTTYELLGHNIGLNIKTLHNWDFVNPNSSDAHSLVLTVLSAASSLTINWFYNGTLSPWTSPTVSATGGTRSFQGTTYNVHEVSFSTGKSWSGGANGVAPPSVKFHVGATFAESDAVIVYEVTLEDSGGADLPLKPRLFGYDAGAADAASGDFVMTFFNPSPGDGVLILRDLQIHYFPRLVDIQTMVAGLEPLAFDGLPVGVIDRVGRSRFGQMEVEDKVEVRIAGLADKRHVDITYDPEDCERGLILPQATSDARIGDVEYCPEGIAVSLFPATSVYVTATMVDPDARFWDPDTGDFVEGPLESRLFYQFAGIVPDLNRNGIDDLIDIRTGTSVDANGNGVPDEAEPEEEPEEKPWLPLWLIILLIILLLVLFIHLLVRRR